MCGLSTHTLTRLYLRISCRHASKQTLIEKSARWSIEVLVAEILLGHSTVRTCGPPQQSFVVKKVVSVVPSASSRFAAKAHMIEVLLRQKYWCPIALLEFLQSGDEAISVEGFSIEAVPGKVDLARNQIADIDVLDLDMDFFYDPGSDSVNVQCLHTFDALGKKLHPRIFAISKSVADGYCPTAMCESRGAC